MTTKFINRLGQGYRETVDEFSSNDEASPKEFRKYVRKMLVEYRHSDPSAEYYISSRACKSWSE